MFVNKVRAPIASIPSDCALTPAGNAYGNSATCSNPAVSGKPSIRFMFLIAAQRHVRPERLWLRHRGYEVKMTINPMQRICSCSCELSSPHHCEPNLRMSFLSSEASFVRAPWR